MSDNSRKTPLARSLNRLAIKAATDAIALLGKALPCSVVSRDGAFVTIKFEVNSGFTIENITVPIAGIEWVRTPLPEGTPGVAFPADARLGGISGDTPGVVPTLDTPGNLSALMFFPIGNKAWQDEDPNLVTIYGVDGVTIKTKDGAVSIKVTSSGVAITGTLTINGQPYLNHEHSGVAAGGAVTGPVVP